MKAIVEAIDYVEWKIEGWQIKFLLSEKQLHQVKKMSMLHNWYEDPVVTDTWIEKLCICFNSIQKFHNTFGVLPQVGDRLFDEDSGMIVQDRAIDGSLMTITFTLST